MHRYVYENSDVDKYIQVYAVTIITSSKLLVLRQVAFYSRARTAFSQGRKQVTPHSLTSELAGHERK